MKSFIRILITVAICIYITNSVIGAFWYGMNTLNTFLLLTLGLSLIEIGLKPVLKVLTFAQQGIWFLFVSGLVNVLSLYFFTLFIPSFSIVASTIGELLILGVMLPSKSLSPMESVIFSGILFTVLRSFFKWLYQSSK